jgi:cytoskeletal protein CcmA (bactofilin family)
VSETPADRPRRRLFDQVSGAPTLIGSGTRFEGRLEVSGPMSLSGTIIGDGVISGALSIAQGGDWRGNVSAQSAVITGRVTGDLLVEAKLEIGKTAVMHGRVQARIIAIADGALVDGEMLVTGDAPIVHFTEKREPSDAGG